MSERPLPLPVSFVGSVLMCLSWDQLIKSRDKDACFCRDNLPTTYTPSPYLLSLLTGGERVCDSGNGSEQWISSWVML